MKKADVIKHFGGVAETARALNISHSAVNQWGETIPPGAALRAFCASDGELFLDPWVYAEWPVGGRVTRPDDRRCKKRSEQQEAA